MPAARSRRRPPPPHAPKPGFVEMVDPTLVTTPPSSAGWTHEVKADGYRLQAHKDGARVQLFTRNGHDWTDKFGPIAAAVGGLKADSVIFDGEVVAFDKDNISDFHELRRQIGSRSQRLSYQVFDVLWLDGEDLRPLPLSERKARLKRVLARAGAAIALVEGLEADGPKVLQGACRLHLEGIVSKRLDAPYRAGRSHAWLKAKCEVSETFAVVGYSENDRGRIDGLYIGRADAEGLRYAGQVENGLGADDIARFERELPPTMVPASPLIETPRDKRKAKWVRPAVLVEVGYPNKADDGRIRHPTFKGFRDDIVPKRPERAAARKRR